MYGMIAFGLAVPWGGVVINPHFERFIGPTPERFASLSFSRRKSWR